MTEGLVQGEGFAVDASIIRADANRSKHTDAEGAASWKLEEVQSRAVREYIEALMENNPVKDDAEPTTTNTMPSNNMSLTDPGSRFTSAAGGNAFYSYSTNYLIDLHAGIIMDVEAMHIDLIDRRFVHTTFVHRDFFRYRIGQQDLVEKAPGCYCAPLRRQKKIDLSAVLVRCPTKILS